MSLTVYEDISDIEKDSIIYKNDLVFNRNKDKIAVSADMIRIIKAIDNSDYLSGTSIITRYGEAVDITKSSTSCKTVLNVLLYPDKIVNCIEAGESAMEYILEHFNNGKIYTPFLPSLTHHFNTDIDYITSDGSVIHCTDSRQLLEVMSDSFL